MAQLPPYNDFLDHIDNFKELLQGFVKLKLGKVRKKQFEILIQLLDNYEDKIGAIFEADLDPANLRHSQVNSAHQNVISVLAQWDGGRAHTQTSSTMFETSRATIMNACNSAFYLLDLAAEECSRFDQLREHQPAGLFWWFEYCGTKTEITIPEAAGNIIKFLNKNMFCSIVDNELGFKKALEHSLVETARLYTWTCATRTKSDPPPRNSRVRLTPQILNFWMSLFGPFQHCDNCLGSLYQKSGKPQVWWTGCKEDSECTAYEKTHPNVDFAIRLSRNKGTFVIQSDFLDIQRVPIYICQGGYCTPIAKKNNRPQPTIIKILREAFKSKNYFDRVSHCNWRQGYNDEVGGELRGDDRRKYFSEDASEETIQQSTKGLNYSKMKPDEIKGLTPTNFERRLSETDTFHEPLSPLSQPSHSQSNERKENSQDEERSEFEIKIDRAREDLRFHYFCTDCPENRGDKDGLQDHFESKHLSFRLSCNTCGKDNPEQCKHDVRPTNDSMDEETKHDYDDSPREPLIRQQQQPQYIDDLSQLHASQPVGDNNLNSQEYVTVQKKQIVTSRPQDAPKPPPSPVPAPVSTPAPDSQISNELASACDEFASVCVELKLDTPEIRVLVENRVDLETLMKITESDLKELYPNNFKTRKKLREWSHKQQLPADSLRKDPVPKKTTGNYTTFGKADVNVLTATRVPRDRQEQNKADAESGSHPQTTQETPYSVVGKARISPPTSGKTIHSDWRKPMESDRAEVELDETPAPKVQSKTESSPKQKEAPIVQPSPRPDPTPTTPTIPTSPVYATSAGPPMVKQDQFFKLLSVFLAILVVVLAIIIALK